jgi:FkbM family methyltransferase
MRSFAVRLVMRLPSSLAARMKGESRAASFLRPIINWMLPAGQLPVEVRSGLAAGIRLEVFPRSEKYYWLGTYEPQVLQEIAIRLRPGATYWDVGSHIGYLVAAASRLVGATGTVVAFEPNPENVRRLRRTIELNGLRNVIVREVALSDRVGQSELSLSGPTSSLLEDPSGRPTARVRTSTVDEELKTLAFPDLVKMDVEGGESAVLAGATRLIENHRPELIVEVLTPERRRGVEDLLVGYQTSMLDKANLLARPTHTNS